MIRDSALPFQATPTPLSPSLECLSDGEAESPPCFDGNEISPEEGEEDGHAPFISSKEFNNCSIHALRLKNAIENFVCMQGARPLQRGLTHVASEDTFGEWLVKGSEMGAPQATLSDEDLPKQPTNDTIEVAPTLQEPSQRATHEVSSPRASGAVPARAAVQLRLSSMSTEEHNFYLESCKPEKYAQMDSIMKNALAQLAIRVQAEQSSYQREICQQCTTGEAAARYLHYSAPVEAQVEAALTERRCRALKLPRLVRLHRTFSLTSVQCAQGDPLITPMGALLRIGACLEFRPPKSGAVIPVAEPYFESSTACDATSSRENGAWQLRKRSVAVVSGDERCHQLAAEHDVDVVMSSSSLGLLMATTCSARGWDLPITVGERGSGTGKRVVFLDKPLVQRSMTLRDKNQLLAFLALLTVASIPCVIDGGQADRAESSAPAAAEAGTAMNDGERVRALEGELGGMGVAKERSGSGSGAGPRPEWGGAQPLLSEGNWTYVLWQLGTLRILVRCAYRGHLHHGRANRYIVVRAKLEYHPELGWEQLTAEERARWWVAVLLRPEATLMLGRVCPREGRLLAMQQLLPDALLEASRSGFSPVKASKALLEVLHHLRQLRSGAYLLQRPPSSPLLHCFHFSSDLCSHIPPDAAPTAKQHPESPHGPSAVAGHLSESQGSPQAPALASDAASAGIPALGESPGIDEPCKLCAPEWSAPPCERCAARVFDLHRGFARAGATASRQLPYVPVVWQPHRKGVPQIPGTFPPRPPQAPPQVAQESPMRKTKKERKKAWVFYCHKFAAGLCPAGTDCVYPHLTPAQVAAAKEAAANEAAMRQETAVGTPFPSARTPDGSSRVKARDKVYVRHCFVHLKTGKCPNGVDCAYPHLSRAEVDRAILSKEQTAEQMERSRCLNRSGYLGSFSSDARMQATGHTAEAQVVAPMETWCMEL
ncbi:hypothetical protein CYMTET_8459 [Cymbomonas tetramitiformis]|uniref:C3H1-type domain-containing protein n=1 Tax=Cymbomonas tetramitiformis TaxID=36881 RepID=A0AAE0LFZ2_9CHLO|nr:hypothetical protein CYMTET_8459 [Cymbomonas tetramitiformis]